MLQTKHQRFIVGLIDLRYQLLEILDGLHSYQVSNYMQSTDKSFNLCTLGEGCAEELYVKCNCYKLILGLAFLNIK